jgi:2-dehydro-3-deoxyphosphogluconate aldolase/(4S)-4-hydroxy-2-oxoglutarate aldolase
MSAICNDQDVLWMPGCTTTSDITWARSLGASVIGVLPANILGPEFIRSVKQENPDLEFIPSGIVETNLEALAKWYQAGSMCLKLSTPLFPKEAITAKDWASIEKGIFGHLKNISKIRASLKPVNPH